MTEDEKIPCEFSAVALDYENEGVLVQNKIHYLRKLKTISINNEKSYFKFRSERIKLAWMASTHPDCLFEKS